MKGNSLNSNHNNLDSFSNKYKPLYTSLLCSHFYSLRYQGEFFEGWNMRKEIEERLAGENSRRT